MVKMKFLICSLLVWLNLFFIEGKAFSKDMGYPQNFHAVTFGSPQYFDIPNWLGRSGGGSGVPKHNYPEMRYLFWIPMQRLILGMGLGFESINPECRIPLIMKEFDFYSKIEFEYFYVTKTIYRRNYNFLFGTGLQYWPKSNKKGFFFDLAFLMYMHPMYVNMDFDHPEDRDNDKLPLTPGTEIKLGIAF